MSDFLRKHAYWVMIFASALAGTFLGEAYRAEATLSSGREEARPEPNAVDLGFLQSMLIHHNQAIEMALMVKRSTSEEVQAMAQGIVISQTHETGLMKGWLTAWQKPVIVPGPPMRWVEEAEGVTNLDDILYADQCKAANGKMAGLATPEQLAELKRLEGKEQEKLFLELMLAHHDSALPMARFAYNNGRSPLVRNLAKTMRNEQAHEMNWMKMNLTYKYTEFDQP